LFISASIEKTPFGHSVRLVSQYVEDWFLGW
jgi:hypothetical protein